MKKIISLLIGLLMIATVLAAPPVPYPVKIIVDVNGHKIDYLDAKITNKATGEVLTPKEVGTLQILNGIGWFDLHDFKQGFESSGRRYGGDVVEITACSIHPSCTTLFVIDDLNPRTVRISIQDKSIPIERIIVDKTVQCWNGQRVYELRDCPPVQQPKPEVIEKEKIVEVEKIVCSDGTEVQKIEDCKKQEDYSTTIFASLVTLILGILIAKYKWASGLLKALQNRISRAKTKELKDKELKRAIKTAKTIIQKDKEGKYK